MAEKKIVVESQVINYEGLFNVRELYMLIDTVTQQKGYDKVELLNSEQVIANSKDMVILLDPYKKITEYAKLNLWIKLVMANVTDVKVEKDGKKINTNQGKVTIIMQGFLHTDYEARWEQKPWFVFVRTIFDKFIYRIYSDSYERQLKQDYDDVFNQLKGYLNLQKN